MDASAVSNQFHDWRFITSYYSSTGPSDRPPYTGQFKKQKIHDSKMIKEWMIKWEKNSHLNNHFSKIIIHEWTSAKVLLLLLLLLLCTRNDERVTSWFNGGCARCRLRLRRYRYRICNCNADTDSSFFSIEYQTGRLRCHFFSWIFFFQMMIINEIYHGIRTDSVRPDPIDWEYFKCNQSEKCCIHWS